MQRRRKIHARPNVATASIGIRPKATEIDVKSPSVQANISGDEQPQSNENPLSAVDNVDSPTTIPQSPISNVDHSTEERHSPIKIPKIIIREPPNNEQSNSPQTPMVELERPATGFRPPSTPEALETPVESNSINLHQIVQQRMSSATIDEMMRAQSEQRESQKRHREPLKDELCDTKKFTMADLVNWKPKTENTLRKKWAEKRKALKQSMEEQEGNEEGHGIEKKEEAEVGSSKSIENGQSSGTAAGPRVKINEHGQIVVDEESLVLVNNPENNEFETIQDDFIPKKLTSMSFRKNVKKGGIWNVQETDLFHEVLAATGTDFGLMHEFIKSRSRAELKQKFNREQRLNPKRLDETLRNPVLLDERLRQRVERILGEIKANRKKNRQNNELE